MESAMDSPPRRGSPEPPPLTALPSWQTAALAPNGAGDVKTMMEEILDVRFRDIGRQLEEIRKELRTHLPQTVTSPTSTSFAPPGCVPRAADRTASEASGALGGSSVNVPPLRRNSSVGNMGAATSGALFNAISFSVPVAGSGSSIDQAWGEETVNTIGSSLTRSEATAGQENDGLPKKEGTREGWSEVPGAVPRRKSNSNLNLTAVVPPVMESEQSNASPAANPSFKRRGSEFEGRRLVGVMRKTHRHPTQQSDHTMEADDEYMLSPGKAKELYVVKDRTRLQKLHTFVSGLVLRPAFDWGVCTLIVVNALFLGVQTDFMARTRLDEIPEAFKVCESIFCGCFTVELMARLYVFRYNYFTMPGWQWNVFDAVVVTLQLTEELLVLMGSSFFSHNLSFARLLRVMRLVRIIRLARILRMIHELRVLVSCIGNSVKSLVWTVLLLLILIYSVALVITQLVSDHLSATKSDCQSGTCYYQDDLMEYYGNLLRSMLSLFEAISGGVDWDVLLDPLMEEISPFLGALFCLYVMFSLLAMMNVVTGIFVDSVLMSAKQDKDLFLLNNAREIFKGAPDGLISREQFLSMLENKHMMEFFRGIDVDISLAGSLFTLMDLDDSGEIDAEEFLSGCIKLRGPAKALDTAVLVRDVRKILERLRDLPFHGDGYTSGGSLMPVPPIT